MLINWTDKFGESKRSEIRNVWHATGEHSQGQVIVNFSPEGIVYYDRLGKVFYPGHNDDELPPVDFDMLYELADNEPPPRNGLKAEGE